MATKALITGITGMVGSHLADYLLENTDWEIYGMCRWRSATDNVEHLLDRVNKRDRVYFQHGDLNDLSSLIHVLNEAKPDYVFHLAAQSYPRTSFDAPADTLQTNIIGTNNLLEAIRFSKLNPVSRGKALALFALFAALVAIKNKTNSAIKATIDRGWKSPGFVAISETPAKTPKEVSTIPPPT